MIPQGFAIVKSVFPPTRCGKAFALFGPVMGLSAVAGPILAGVLIDADLFGTGWRMIFLINVPIGLAGPRRRTPLHARAEDRRRPRLDAAGVLLVSLASALLIYPLVQGRELGWPAWSIAMMSSAIRSSPCSAGGERRSRATRSSTRRCSAVAGSSPGSP